MLRFGLHKTTGDSMFPDIKDGDMVMLDTGKKNLINKADSP